MPNVTREELAEALKQMIEEFWGTEASPSSPSVIMAAGSILSRLDAEREGSVCVDEPCPYCLRPVTDCDCCDADVDSEMGDQ